MSEERTRTERVAGGLLHEIVMRGGESCGMLDFDQMECVSLFLAPLIERAIEAAMASAISTEEELRGGSLGYNGDGPWNAALAVLEGS